MTRLLVVDDHPLLLEGIRGQLSQMSDALIVGHAASGEGALQMVDNVQPDVIIMDVSMAGMGGNRDHETTARW